MTQVYCDGCRKKNGAGGYGVVVINTDGSVEIKGGYEDEVTNNQMELRSCIQGLKITKDAVILVSDSQYALQVVEKKYWTKNGYKNARYLQLLGKYVEGREVRCQWVRGHSDNTFNILADRIANFCCKFRQEININFDSIGSLLEANENYLMPKYVLPITVIEKPNEVIETPNIIVNKPDGIFDRFTT